MAGNQIRITNSLLCKAMCPEGHEIAFNLSTQRYWCETCMSDFDEAEVELVPVELPKPSHHQSVYGHLN